MSAAWHIDLYRWTRQNLVLPIPGLGLKEVSEYFGISRESDVTSGLAAEAMWLRYQRCGDHELQVDLVSYNLDDLQSLVHATEYLRAHAHHRLSNTAVMHPVLEATVSEHEPDGPPAWAGTRASAVPPMDPATAAFCLPSGLEVPAETGDVSGPGLWLPNESPRR